MMVVRGREGLYRLMVSGRGSYLGMRASLGRTRVMHAELCLW